MSAQQKQSQFIHGQVHATGGQPVGVLWASQDCRHDSKAQGRSTSVPTPPTLLIFTSASRRNSLPGLTCLRLKRNQV
ncbi:hypothetical protein D3C76_389160 [compost metagenome]|jgi:hypothetical protein